MEKWADYYERLFNFREIRYFDIKGAKTGLLSKAMTAPDGMVRIPLNESSDPKSQINEYLDQYHGEGIQHIACFTDDIYATVEKMRAQGVELPGHAGHLLRRDRPAHPEPRRGPGAPARQQDPDRRRSRRPSSASCCRSSPRTRIGPIFFEIIQRKGNEGFGEGNFQALFESIERDQMRAACCDLFEPLSRVRERGWVRATGVRQA
jgi:4-hydroxyphenylpyruvate dioxygenase